jgi:hypothetical protein
VIRLAGMFACVGTAVCLLLIAVWKVSSAAQLWTINRAVVSLMTVLWPASFGLMAIHAGSTTRDVILVYTILILINAALYGLIGVVVAAFIKIRKH